MHDELDVYVPKVGDLEIGEYLLLFSMSLLPEQERPASDIVVESTRAVLEHIRSRFPDEAPHDPNVPVEPLRLSTIIEYASHEGLLERFPTPVRIDPYLLEPALILGGHRPGQQLSYDDLSKRVGRELEADAREVLGR